MAPSRRLSVELKKKFDMSHFDVNAVIRGAQLTLVGAHRALQNPDIFTSKHYRQAALAVGAGIAIRLAIAVPIVGIRALLWFLSFAFSLDKVIWDNSIIHSLTFVEEHVLQVPLFLMTLMRHVSPTLDDMFMDSLRWVDVTYVQKHREDDSDRLRDMYYPNLQLYGKRDGSTHSASSFMARFARKALFSLAVFALSFLPVAGRFVLPLASLYTFDSAVGHGPASLIFGVGVFLPRRYLVIFLQTYFSSRSLVRELLEPYFARVCFDRDQKKRWFRSREGLLFGFGVGFLVLVRVPLLGVLIYGIAEASTAYLITKITDPPPCPHTQEAIRAFAESQAEWRNKQRFLSLELARLDTLHSLHQAATTSASGENAPLSYEHVVSQHEKGVVGED